jgi:hypothetical protein
MKRLFQLALGALVFGAMLLPQPAWAWGERTDTTPSIIRYAM